MIHIANRLCCPPTPLPCYNSRFSKLACNSTSTPIAFTTRHWNSTTGEYDEKYGVDHIVKLREVNSYPPYVHSDHKHIDVFDPTNPSFMSTDAYITALMSPSNPAIDNICKQLLNTNSKEVIVYIHGFNNNLKDAINGGKLIQDATGVQVVSYDWASTNKKGNGDEKDDISWLRRKSEPEVANILCNYSKDSETAIASVRPFVWLLHVLFYNFETVNIVCHSMGSRVVTESVKNMSNDYFLSEGFPRNRDLHKRVFTKLKTIIFIQPDIDIFNMANFWYSGLKVVLSSPDIKSAKTTFKGVVIYAQGNDAPLEWSKFLHGGTPRVGQITPEYIDSLVTENKIEDLIGKEIEGAIKNASMYIQYEYPKIVPEFISDHLPKAFPLAVRMIIPFLPSGHGYFENKLFQADLRELLTTKVGSDRLRKGLSV
jgi:esterase/lipase superfamily enzyme